MPWHPFPLFSISSVLFFLRTQKNVTSWANTPQQRQLLTHFCVLPQCCGFFVLPDGSCYPLGCFPGWMALSTQEEPSLDTSGSWQGVSYLVSWRWEDELGWRREDGKWEADKRERVGRKEVREKEDQEGGEVGKEESLGRRNLGRRRREEQKQHQLTESLQGTQLLVFYIL